MEQPRNQPSAAVAGGKRAGPASGAGDRTLTQTESSWDQLRVNLRAWFPFLQGAWRQRMVRYTSRENREGGVWRLGLPRQCAQCGGQAALSRMTANWTIRNVEHAVGGAGLMIALILGGLLLSIWTSMMPLFLGLLMAAAVAGLMWMMGTPEDIRLTWQACEVHSRPPELPSVAVFDNELYVFLQSAQLADAARQEQSSERRGGKRYVQEESEAPAPAERPAASARSGSEKPVRKPSAEKDAPPAPVVPKREALPPIKLDGDD